MSVDPTATTFVGRGVHRLPVDAYHADPCERPSLSSTLARLILDRSPLHAWTASPRLNPDFRPEDKKTFDIGRAAHREVLGAGGDWAVYPEEVLAKNGAASTKEAKAWEAETRARGVTPIKADEAEAVKAMAAICRDRLRRLGLPLDPERSELAAIGDVDDVTIRALVDNAPARGPLIDFKTTMNASADGCVRAVTSYGYDVQIAHYLDAWKAATGERREMFLVFQEKDPPYEVTVAALHEGGDDADWFVTARDKAREARRIWGECLASGHWPGYPHAVTVIGAPGWHTQKWEARPKPSPETLDRARRWQAPRPGA